MPLASHCQHDMQPPAPLLSCCFSCMALPAGSCGRCYEVACRSTHVRDGYGNTLDRTNSCQGQKSVIVTVCYACAWNSMGACVGVCAPPSQRCRPVVIMTQASVDTQLYRCHAGVRYLPLHLPRQLLFKHSLVSALAIMAAEGSEHTRQAALMCPMYLAVQQEHKHHVVAL